MDGDEPPPKELLMAWECDRWRCLPETGGYYEQDYGLMRRMTALSNVYRALSKLRNASGKQIHNLTESERRILKLLVDMGLLFNG